MFSPFCFFAVLLFCCFGRCLGCSFQDNTDFAAAHFYEPQVTGAAVYRQYVGVGGEVMVRFQQPS